LYLILDRQVNSYTELFRVAQKAIIAGVDVLQLRDKTGTAREILSFSEGILKLTRKKVLYVINDRVDLAIISGASGVHLGQEDISVAAARKMVGPEALIGVSCQTYARVQKARKDGADYIGFGSVFKTLTKPDRHAMDSELLRKIIPEARVPLFAIGGITLENIGGLRGLGVDRVAVCRAVCQARDVGQAVRQFKALLAA
jgi:thiamine-phosphate diphosphorylase